jgi:hypothetical protein
MVFISISLLCSYDCIYKRDQVLAFRRGLTSDGQHVEAPRQSANWIRTPITRVSDTQKAAQQFSCQSARRHRGDGGIMTAKDKVTDITIAQDKATKRPTKQLEEARRTGRKQLVPLLDAAFLRHVRKFREYWDLLGRGRIKACDR